MYVFVTYKQNTQQIIGIFNKLQSSITKSVNYKVFQVLSFILFMMFDVVKTFVETCGIILYEIHLISIISFNNILCFQSYTIITTISFIT